jgi:hypothetical protein
VVRQWCGSAVGDGSGNIFIGGCVSPFLSSSFLCFLFFCNLLKYSEIWDFLKMIEIEDGELKIYFGSLKEMRIIFLYFFFFLLVPGSAFSILYSPLVLSFCCSYYS